MQDLLLALLPLQIVPHGMRAGIYILGKLSSDLVWTGMRHLQQDHLWETLSCVHVVIDSYD